MKKPVAFLAALVLILTTAACDSQPAASNSSASSGMLSSAPESTVSAMPSAPEAGVSASSGQEAVPEQEDKKTLVVYYSASGNTEAVAQKIAAATGADLFELVPTEPYTEDDLNWNDEDSRVVYEHDNPDARSVALESANVSDWETYDTVFIGYPIWWGIAAWPVDGFIGANDFTGKTVIPFCTSSSSGLGESGDLLAAMAGTGNWQSGQRFSGAVSDSAVREWLDTLELS